jgi:hypothetical protein
MKPTVSAKKASKSRSSSTKNIRSRLPGWGSSDLRFVVCVQADVNVDLEQYKVYKVKTDREARAQGLIRVVDASGEDCLYPIKFFKPIIAPRRLF